MVFGVSRLTFSIFPPIHIAKARRALKPWRESPEMAPSCKKLFATLDAAQVLTAVAPVLSVAGGIMMVMSTQKGNVHYYGDEFHHTTSESQALKIAGWALVGAGLVATLSATILITDAKQELSQKTGQLKLTINTSGVGLQYKLPAK